MSILIRYRWPVTNAATVYAIVYGPIIFLAFAAAPFPLRVTTITSKVRTVWFWAGMAWLGILVVAAVTFTTWWAQPARWGGSFTASSLFIPLWMLLPGVGVAAARLLRRHSTARVLLHRAPSAG
ncbi:hypothetical protein [Actinoplanes subglobosus]|uniref:Uncharacterized protein n=1 Tax=Actinoplanes subglobosus TaxID=1547892 RepID=A0ABV8IRZ4_9ACTN